MCFGMVIEPVFFLHALSTQQFCLASVETTFLLSVSLCEPSTPQKKMLRPMAIIQATHNHVRG